MQWHATIRYTKYLDLAAYCTTRLKLTVCVNVPVADLYVPVTVSG